MAGFRSTGSLAAARSSFGAAWRISSREIPLLSTMALTGNWFAELCAISRTSPTFRNLDVTRVRPY